MDLNSSYVICLSDNRVFNEKLSREMLLLSNCQLQSFLLVFKGKFEVQDAIFCAFS